MKSRLLKIEFQSDWHIGSGAGIPGSVDRQVLRDSQGLPYIPGKTLTGILRDAAEFITDIRGEKVSLKLFGNQLDDETAQRAKIGISSAELPKNIRDYILANDLTSALFYVQPGIKIDPKTGCSEKDHLFSIEKVRHECVLYSEVFFLEELSDDETKLLNDAVKAVRRLGGKRRRGAGLCRMNWYSELNEKEIPHKDSLLIADKPLAIRLTCLQPLIIAGKTFGNSVRCETEIPGYMLLSYYVNEVFAPLGKERMQKAVMNNEISVSNFLPELYGSCALPVPLCMAEKKESKELVNRLIHAPADNEQMKDIRTGYIVVSSNKITYYPAGVHKIFKTHNTIEDSSQRPDKTTGSLFTYEAIEAGQKFIGSVKISKSLLDDIMQSEEKYKIISKLSGDIHKIGRSRKDEYGEVMIEHISQSDENITLIGKNYLIVYLKSDLILKDSYNGYSTKIEDVKKTLSYKLDIILEDIPENEWIERNNFNISPLGGTRGHCIRTGRRDSWQAFWGLPRPSLIYFREGSIFVFKVINPENWNDEKIKALLQKGLGERTAEGYGQILINPAFLCDPEITVSRSDTSIHDDKNMPISCSVDFLDILQKDAMRRRFRQVARCEAYTIIRENDNQPFLNYPDISCAKNKRPSTSQFGALREAVANGHGVFKKWVEVISRKNTLQNPWNNWLKMLNDLSEHPEGFVNLRPSFANFETETAEDFIGIFFDVLCEAVFDDERSC